MDYCSLTDVKGVLQISLAETKYDAQLSTCITSGSALVDGFLKAKTLSVPSVTPELIVCSAKFFAAWEFRRFSDPVGAEAFWVEANRFLNTHVEAEVEPYVGGV
jgi:hypothetical protein